MEILEGLVTAIKEDGMSVAEMRQFLPAAILAAAQRNPESTLANRSMEEILDDAQRIYEATPIG